MAVMMSPTFVPEHDEYTDPEKYIGGRHDLATIGEKIGAVCLGEIATPKAWLMLGLRESLQAIVMLPGGITTGGVVSRTVIVWTAVLELHPSVAVQVREITSEPVQILLTISL